MKWKDLGGSEKVQGQDANRIWMTRNGFLLRKMEAFMRRRPPCSTFSPVQATVSHSYNSQGKLMLARVDMKGAEPTMISPRDVFTVSREMQNIQKRPMAFADLDSGIANSNSFWRASWDINGETGDKRAFVRAFVSIFKFSLFGLSLPSSSSSSPLYFPRPSHQWQSSHSVSKEGEVAP